MEKRKKRRTKNLRPTRRSFDDRISLLPDEILAMILSQLPINQAARTSILSRRWKTLWTFTTTLDFDCTEIGLFGYLLNQALESHQGPTLHRLRICLVEGTISADVSSWIEFAIRKSVQDLEFELKRSFFPVLGFSQFYSLNTLSLCDANVKDCHVEYFLSHCPNLETLRLIDLGYLQNLTISSKSLVFLEISRCLKLISLTISAANLVSFKYWGHDGKVTIGHAPLLVEVSFFEAYCSSLVKYKFKEFEGVLSQLQKLKLTMTYAWATKFPKLDGLKNLNKVEVQLKVWGYDHAFNLCTSILKSLPFLHKFSLHLFQSEDDDHHDNESRKKWVPIVENGRHHCLRVMEFVGFIGCLLDVHIIRFVGKNAVSLEKMTISTCRQAWIHSHGDVMQIEEREEARKRARRLGVELSPYTRLFVL